MSAVDAVTTLGDGRPDGKVIGGVGVGEVGSAARPASQQARISSPASG